MAHAPWQHAGSQTRNCGLGGEGPALGAARIESGDRPRLSEEKHDERTSHDRTSILGKAPHAVPVASNLAASTARLCPQVEVNLPCNSPCTPSMLA